MQTFQNTHAQFTRSVVKLSKVVQGKSRWFGELLNSALFFLQPLLERVLSHSAIKVYVSAVSACHEGFGEKWVSNILSWNISNKARGGNVWWCAPLQERTLDHLKSVSKQLFRPDGQISHRMSKINLALLFAWESVCNYIWSAWAAHLSEAVPHPWPNLYAEHFGMSCSILVPQRRRGR